MAIEANYMCRLYINRKLKYQRPNAFNIVAPANFENQ